jgi:hypothetical protein
VKCRRNFINPSRRSGGCSGNGVLEMSGLILDRDTVRLEFLEVNAGILP